MVRRRQEEKGFAQHHDPRQPGPGGGVLAGAKDARWRRGGNGPKAPAGRFWPMPSRRPLVGGKGSASRFAGVRAPAAGSYALGDRSPFKAIRKYNYVVLKVDTTIIGG